MNARLLGLEVSGVQGQGVYFSEEVFPYLLTVLEFISKSESFEVICDIPYQTDSFVFLVLILTDEYD